MEVERIGSGWIETVDAHGHVEDQQQAGESAQTFGLENPEDQIGEQSVANENSEILDEFSQSVIVSQIWNVIEILGQDEVESSRRVSIGYGVIDPNVGVMGSVVVLQVISIGQANIKEREQSQQEGG